ncbi:MAG: hypothetical protein J0L75_02865 [Spirochaetes bacterium]|nr:hypothetical protein [Spirochaetota bacterium]
MSLMTVFPSPKFPIFLGIAVIALLAAAPLAAAENLLKNGDFEELGGASLSGWTTEGKEAVVEASTEGAFIRGKVSAMIRSASTNAAVRAGATVAQPVPGAEPGRTYALAFFAKGEKSGQVLTVIYDAWRPVGAHWYRKKEVPLTAEWKKYALEESIPGAAEWDGRKLTIRFSIGYGSVFLDEVSLTAVVKEDGGSAQRSLLENPGFDDGISGWFAESWAPTWAVSSNRMGRDFAVKHRGACSLKLPFPGTSLISRRYAFKPDTAYTASFWARSDDASGQGLSAFLITPDWKIFKTEVPARELGRDWKRYSVAFKAPSQGNAYGNSFYIRVDPRSTVWVDSFQLEEGPATDYDPGIQAGIEPYPPSGIYKAGQPGTVRVSATRNAPWGEAHLLTLQGCGADGAVQWTKSVEIPGDAKDVRESLALPTERLGVIDLRASIAAKSAPGKSIASAQWRVVVIAGDYALPPNPLLGLDTAPAWAPLPTLLSEEGLAAGFAAGMGRSFFSTSGGWPVGERKNTSVEDPMHVRALREAYAIPRASGKSTMVVFDAGRASPLSLRNMKRDGKLIPLEEREAAIPEFAKNLAAWVVALSNVFDMVEVFNEPNIWVIGGEKGMPPELYVKALSAAHRAVRAVNQNVRLAADMNGMDFEYAEKLVKLGGAAFFDVFTVHPYRATAENPPLYEDYRKLRAILDKARPGIPVVNSEQYFGVRNPVYQMEHERNYFADSEEDQAGRLLQTALHGFAAEAVPFSLFAPGAMVGKEGISDSRYFYHSFGMLRTLGRLTRGLARGEELACDKSLRVFLLELADGSRLVTANTRIFGVKGTVKLPLAAEAAWDPNGNPISQDAVPVGYTPTYWSFAKATPAEAIRRAFRSATCRGFDFPVELSASLGADGKVRLTLKNVSTTPAAGTVKFDASPVPWAFPTTLPFDLAPGAVAEKRLEAGGAKPAWNAQYAVPYAAQSEDLIVRRVLRLPSLLVPKAAKAIAVDGDLSDWDDAPWMTLGEEALSKNFSAKLPHQGAADFGARVALRWADGGLYLAARVRDDVAFQKGNPNTLYERDSLQLYFDLGNNASPQVHAYDKDDVVYAIGLDESGRAVANLEKSPGTRYIGANNVETGLDADVKVACRSLPDGYAYEVFFPSFTLPFLAIKPGSVFGVSLLLNDNDGAGRKQGLTLGPKGTEPFGEPSLWRCAQLGE